VQGGGGKGPDKGDTHIRRSVRGAFYNRETKAGYKPGKGSPECRSRRGGVPAQGGKVSAAGLYGEGGGYTEKGQKDKKPPRLFCQGNFAKNGVEHPANSAGSGRDTRQKALQDQGGKQGNSPGKQKKEKPVQGQGKTGKAEPQVEKKYRQSGDKNQQKENIHIVPIYSIIPSKPLG
jgi:hypothetical protein